MWRACVLAILVYANKVTGASTSESSVDERRGGGKIHKRSSGRRESPSSQTRKNGFRKHWDQGDYHQAIITTNNAARAILKSINKQKSVTPPMQKFLNVVTNNLRETAEQRMPLLAESTTYIQTAALYARLHEIAQHCGTAIHLPDLPKETILPLNHVEQLATLALEKNTYLMHWQTNPIKAAATNKLPLDSHIKTLKNRQKPGVKQRKTDTALANTIQVALFAIEMGMRNAKPEQITDAYRRNCEVISGKMNVLRSAVQIFITTGKFPESLDDPAMNFPQIPFEPRDPAAELTPQELEEMYKRLDL